MIDRLKISALSLFIISTLIIAGCGETEVAEPTSSPYMGGTKGIVAEFMDMGIYSEADKINSIYQDETFPIEIILKNKGEHDVEAGEATVTLKGIYLGSFSGIVSDGKLSNDDTIEKIEDINVQGGEVTLDFTPGSDDAKYLVDFSGTSVDLDVFAELAYDYATEATIKKVCFKEDLHDESVCDIDETKDVHSSGAPIQVRAAKEATAGSAKIGVDIDIENVGDGDVAIIGQEFDNRYDKFTFVSSNEDKWECRSGGKVNEGRFDSAGKAKITCKLKEAMPENTLYTEDLSLSIRYSYRTLIQESIRIKKE